MARKRLASCDAVRRASRANLRQGRYEENGYKYLPEADLSIQGVDANLACEHSFRLARARSISLKVPFEWRDKEDAAHPGQSGIIERNPSGRLHGSGELPSCPHSDGVSADFSALGTSGLAKSGRGSPQR